jgi:hypothetical protein
MTEGARILWCIAIDSSSPALQSDDFIPAFSKVLKECTVLQSADPSKTVLRLRLLMRLRPTPIVQALRPLLQDGRVRRAWIERPDGPEKVQMLEGPRLEMEAVSEMKKRKGALGAKKQKMHENGAQSEEEEDEICEEETSENGSEDGIHTILSTIDHLERQHCATASTLRDLKRKVAAWIQNKEGAPSAIPEKNSIPKLPPPTYILRRPPVRLSWLRAASVSELYYAGVWFPNHDVDDRNPPPREARFRSECTGGNPYIEHLDIDDLLHPDSANPYLQDKSTALKRASFLHFTDTRFRPAVLLRALRTAPYDVLHLLGVFFLDFDVDDEHSLTPTRERLTRIGICDRFHFNPQHVDWRSQFIPGYDIDNIDGRHHAEVIKHAAAECKVPLVAESGVTAQKGAQ